MYITQTHTSPLKPHIATIGNMVFHTCNQVNLMVSYMCMDVYSSNCSRGYSRQNVLIGAGSRITTCSFQRYPHWLIFIQYPEKQDKITHNSTFLYMYHIPHDPTTPHLHDTTTQDSTCEPHAHPNVTSTCTGCIVQNSFPVSNFLFVFLCVVQYLYNLFHLHTLSLYISMCMCIMLHIMFIHFKN